MEAPPDSRPVRAARSEPLRNVGAPAPYGRGSLATGLPSVLLPLLFCSCTTDIIEHTKPDGGFEVSSCRTPADGCTDGGPADADIEEALYAPCGDAGHCPPGWKCLFWNGGCSIGRCEPACPRWYDAGLQYTCDCEGNIRTASCHDFPWDKHVSRGPSGGPPSCEGSDAMPGDAGDAGPVDVEPGDADAGWPGALYAPCWDAGECPPDWKCLFWSGGCSIGRCEPACPEAYDAAFSGWTCDCEGNVRSESCHDFPWSHRTFDAATCTSSTAVDAGADAG